MKKNSTKPVTRKASSLVLMFTGALALVIGLVMLQEPETVEATSTFLSRVRSVYPFISGTRLDDCKLCHTSVPSLNAYGRAFNNAGRSTAGLQSIENEDSDGDGFSNIEEINALTFPGDASDRPAQAATATRTVTRTSAPPTATAVATSTRTPTATRTTAATQTATSVPTGTAQATGTVTTTPGTTTTAQATPVGTPQAQTFRPEADTYINRSSPSSNYGTSRSLRVDQSPINRALLRFNLEGIDFSRVQKAELRLYVTEGSDRGFRVRAVARNDWSERSVRWSNTPGAGVVITQPDEAEAGQWAVADITAYVKSLPSGSDNRVSLAIYGDSTNGFAVASRETGSTRAPQLVISYTP